MASGLQQTPFVKQLASSDHPTRNKALESLRKYLTSSRTFTDLELLKLWKGLFFCMWHSDRPVPQQRLARSLSHLLLPLPPSLFIPFLAAFWTTMAREWTSIDALRMDKFLRLVRCYVNAAFTYVSQNSWDGELLMSYLGVIEAVPLSVVNTKVSDGLRYHVLDVWVEELDRVDEARVGECPVEEAMGPVRRLEREGKGKKVRERAKECLEDERLKNWSSGGRNHGTTNSGSGIESGNENGEEWGGVDT